MSYTHKYVYIDIIVPIVYMFVYVCTYIYYTLVNYNKV